MHRAEERKAGEQGLLCMWADEKYGGLGMTDFRFEQVVIEETIRLEPPVRGLSRVTIREVELGGKLLPEAAHLLLMYASANDEPEILRAISGEGVGACVNSLRHFELAQLCGFDAGSIQFTSSGIPGTCVLMTYRW